MRYGFPVTDTCLFGWYTIRLTLTNGGVPSRKGFMSFRLEVVPPALSELEGSSKVDSYLVALMAQLVHNPDFTFMQFPVLVRQSNSRQLDLSRFAQVLGPAIGDITCIMATFDQVVQMSKLKEVTKLEASRSIPAVFDGDLAVIGV